MTEVFRTACAIHDICYSTPGRSQSDCDRDFGHNMEQTCKFPGVGVVAFPVCLATVGYAVLAVNNPGRTHPDFAATCTEVWIVVDYFINWNNIDQVTTVLWITGPVLHCYCMCLNVVALLICLHKQFHHDVLLGKLKKNQ